MVGLLYIDNLLYITGFAFERERPMKSKIYRSDISTESLEERLKNVLHKREQAETRFRADHVYEWTVMFCDTSRTTKKAMDVDDDILNALTREYREVIDGIVKSFDPPFIAPGDGPQLVACFDTPQQAANAAIKIQSALKKWRFRTDGGQYFSPSIGLHTGDFVIKDDDLKQSNACNLGKRIETQAQGGQVFISLETYQELKGYENYDIKFERETYVKNIPDPQQIYAIHWQNSELLSESEIQKKSKAKFGGKAISEEEEETIEGYMGLIICDVAGSTKKFYNLGDREGNMLIDIFKKEVFLVLKKHKAVHIENREGDMIVACFSMEKPIVNVLAAVEIQKTFFRRNVGLGSRAREKLETSIGIHVGNMIIKNGEVVPTPDFFTCKGIQDMAEASEIALTEEVAKLITEYSHLPLVEAGETKIKGFPDPIKIYLLEWFKSGK